MRAYLAAAGVLVAIPIFAVLQDTHSIKWNPTEGEKSTYKVDVEGSMDIPGAGPMDMHFTLITEGKVAKVADEKVTVVGRMLDMKILIGGQDITEMSGQDTEALKQKEITEVFNMKGERLSTSDTETNAGMERFSRLTNFLYPDKAMAVGEEWTIELKENKEKSHPSARIKYTLKGKEEVEGKSYLSVDFSASELTGDKPMGAIGSYLLEPATGRIFRGKANVNDAQLDPQMPPTNVKYSIQLQ